MFVDQKIAGMEPLQAPQGTTQIADSADFVTKAIQSLVMQSEGLSLAIDGEEKPYRLAGGMVSKVIVGSAWIMFSHDDCVFRTKEIKDRDAFLKFLTDGGSTTTIRFTKVCGCLKRPAETVVAKPRQAFIPRSRRDFGRGGVNEYVTAPSQD